MSWVIKVGAIVAAVAIFITGIAMFSMMETVNAGYVGVKVYLLGREKGVSNVEVLPVGRHFIGINEKLYRFPTFTVNYVWTADKQEQSPTDESISFQTVEGMDVNSDFGISFHVRADKAPEVFQKYQKQIDEITRIYLRNMVRDALNKVSSTQTIDYVYGAGKAKLIEEAQVIVAKQVEPIGINIEKLYLIGRFRLPAAVETALNKKIEAIQVSQQRENEVKEAEAQAKKKIAEAKGTADSILLVAKSQADANLVLAKSLSKELIELKWVEKWDGKMPQVAGAGASMPLVNIGGDGKK